MSSREDAVVAADYRGPRAYIESTNALLHQYRGLTKGWVWRENAVFVGVLGIVGHLLVGIANMERVHDLLDGTDCDPDLFRMRLRRAAGCVLERVRSDRTSGDPP